MILFETQRLIIRKVNPNDIEYLLEIYNSEKNMKFISNGKYNWTKQELKNKLNKINNNSKSKGIGIFIVVLKKEKKIIGEAGLFNSFDNLKKLELGYIIDSKYWEKGFGKELCFALIEYAKHNLKVEKLIARMYAHNFASVNLSIKCGMKKIEEGTTKDNKQYLVFEI